MKIHTYVEKTFNWCEKCCERPETVKMIKTRPLYHLDAMDAYKCDGCGALRDEDQESADHSS